MNLFKNGVGRPSNETLRKRKIFIISVIAVVAVLAGIGIFVGIRYARGDMSSGLFNLASSPVSIKIEATNANKGTVLGTYKNKEVYLSSWRNYKVGFNIKASSTNGSIKSIVVTYNDGGYNTTKKAEAGINKNKKTINGGSGYFDFVADGIRYANVTATDNKGKTRTIKVRVSIDKTAPTVTFKITKGSKQSNGSYPSGTVIQATCSDKISGVTYMKTFDAQDTSDYRTYNSSAVSSKSQSITFVSTGSKRNITTACKDKAGNSTGNKNSSYYGIGVKPAVDYSAQQNQQIIETITGQNNPRVTVTAINKSTNATISTTKSGNSVLLSGWRNYKVRFKVAATSPEKGTTIKSIKWNWNNGGITSTKKSNYTTWVGTKTFNSASANLDFNGEGARLASVVVTDSKGRTTTFQIGANIDLTKPTVKLAWVNLKSAGNSKYYVGSSGKATCSDSLSGTGSVTAYEGLNSKNKTTGSSSASVVLKQTGTNYFVGYCYDKAGNKSAVKNSSLHNYIKSYTLDVSSVSGNPSSWTNKDVKLKVSYVSSVGLASKGISFDNGKTWQKATTKTFTKNQTVYIKVKDKKGNVSDTYTVKITKIDKTAPTITITMQTRQEERGKYPLGSKVLVKCADSGSGATYVEAWSVKLTSNRNYTGSKSGSGVDARSLNMYIKTSGSGRQIAATCYDKAGNNATKYSNKWTVK